MGFVMVIAGVIAGVLFFQGEHWWWLAAAVLSSLVTFWTFGMMHNYAVQAANRRPTYKGGFSDFTTDEVDSVPNALAFVNMLSSVASVALLICSIWLI